jgi:hypothetical protein
MKPTLTTMTPNHHQGDEDSTTRKTMSHHQLTSRVVKRRRRRALPNATPNSSLIRAINYNQVPIPEDNVDPFERIYCEQDVTSSPFYTCPQAPIHSNEYLMNINAHKYHFDAIDHLYGQINHSGTMLPPSAASCMSIHCGEHSHHSDICPYVSLASSLEQENIQLKMRVEELEQRVIQLETAS